MPDKKSVNYYWGIIRQLSVFYIRQNGISDSDAKLCVCYIMYVLDIRRAYKKGWRNSGLPYNAPANGHFSFILISDLPA